MVRISITDEQGKIRTFETVTDASVLTDEQKSRLMELKRGEGRALVLETTPKPENLLTRVIKLGKEILG